MTVRTDPASIPEFPVKLDDDYACQGRNARGEFVTYDDLLSEGDQVGEFSDGEGNVWGPMHVVVRRVDGLWIV